MKNRTLSLVLITLGALAILMGASATVAQVPQPNKANYPTGASVENPSDLQGTQARLTYQGRLTTSSGSPVNSTVLITFRIYDDWRAEVGQCATQRDPGQRFIYRLPGRGG